MGQNFNQKRDFIPPKNIIPIPQEQENLLKKVNCNFSLYFPRMVSWKKEGADLKADTEIISKLEKELPNLFPDLYIVKSTPYFLEFSNPKASKKCAVEFLQRHWGLKKEEILTIEEVVLANYEEIISKYSST